jgi:hypothetical protein
MQRRIELVLLAVLALVLVFVYFRHDSGPGLGGVQAANFQFVPLNVQEPELRLDLLDKIQKSSYAGVRRNVFVYGPAQAATPDPVKSAREIHDAAMKGPIGPHQPPPPPAVTISPATYFGSALMQESGKRMAFFQNGDEVVVVPEGDTFLNNRFRLIRVGPENADVQEVSSGRHGTVPMVPPITNPQALPGGQPPQQDADQQ